LNDPAVRLGRRLDVRGLAFGVRLNDPAIGLGGRLDVRGLTLKDAALNCGHHRHGDGTGGGLANEEKSEEESDGGRRREEHGCWTGEQTKERLVASGGAKRQSK
jgi:hypothetical protein